MTNFDKVKELWEFDDLLSFSTQICCIIRQVRGIDEFVCIDGRDCVNCRKWLQEEYKDD